MRIVTLKMIGKNMAIKMTITMIIAMKIVMMTMMTTKVSIEPVERWEKGILALKIIDELTMWFFTIGDHDDQDD